MDKILYTNSDGSICIVHPAPKEQIEAHAGPLTDKQYEALVLKQSIPEGAIHVRSVREEDLPETREFRDAWVDVTPEPIVDVCCEKARDLKLAELRAKRDALLLENDAKYIKAHKDGASEVEALAERETLLTATDPLKALDVAGKVNDESLLEEIKLLSEI